MTAKLGADAGEQDLELEGLGHIVVGACIETFDGVGVGILTCQHDDRCGHPRLAHPAAGFVPVEVGQVYIEQDEVRRGGLGGFHASSRRVGLDGVQVVFEIELFD